MGFRLLFILFLFQYYIYAQLEDAWVYLNDKPNYEYFIENPLQYCTQIIINAIGICFESRRCLRTEPQPTVIAPEKAARWLRNASKSRGNWGVRDDIVRNLIK